MNDQVESALVGASDFRYDFVQELAESGELRLNSQLLGLSNVRQLGRIVASLPRSSRSDRHFREPLTL